MDSFQYFFLGRFGGNLLDIHSASVLAITTGRELARSSNTARYSSFFISGATVISSVLTHAPIRAGLFRSPAPAEHRLGLLINVVRRFAYFDAALIPAF